MATKQNDENQKNTNPQLDSSTSGLENPPPIQKQPNINYRKETTNINSLETFIELAEDDILKPNNNKRIKNNIINPERNAVKDIQKDISKRRRIQDKGSRFVILDSDSYLEKIDRQLERSSFQQLGYNTSDKFWKKVTSLFQKWKKSKVLDNSWCKFIDTSQAYPGKMYSLIKRHKVDNPVRVITSGCGTAKKKLIYFC